MATSLHNCGRNASHTDTAATVTTAASTITPAWPEWTMYSASRVKAPCVGCIMEDSGVITDCPRDCCFSFGETDAPGDGPQDEYAEG